MRTVGRLAAALTLILLAATALVTEQTVGSGPPPAAPDEEKRWVDFTLPDANGKEVSLNRFIGKRPVLLFFWATWCPHCNEAVPEINRMHEEGRKYGGLQILALDFMESPEKVNAFVSSKKVLYPVLLDRSGRVARKYKVVGIPTYILIDRNGRVVYRDHELPEVNRYLR